MRLDNALAKPTFWELIRMDFGEHQQNPIKSRKGVDHMGGIFKKRTPPPFGEGVGVGTFSLSVPK